jgi:excisionase family DNA binding protein
MAQRLLDGKQAAEYLGTTLRHLEDLRYRRSLPFVKLGGKVRYDVKALDRFITTHTIGRAS